MYLKDSKTVVIKIGSSLLINDKKIVREKWLSEFAKDILHLQKSKKTHILEILNFVKEGEKILKKGELKEDCRVEESVAVTQNYFNYNNVKFRTPN